MLLGEVDPSTELRPVVDQLIDRILAEHKDNESLVKTFADISSELGGRPSLRSLPRDEAASEETLGRFMSAWIAFEVAIREAAVHFQGGIARPFVYPTKQLLEKIGVPGLSIDELDYVRRLRNNVVHGVEPPDPEQLSWAAEVLQKATIAVRKMRSSTASSKKKGDS
jgi:hypothetical protein